MAAVEKKFDITKHILVPAHTILSEEEIQKILQHYNISKVQLPVISLLDPVIKIIGANKGDIVKIERTIASKTPYYRLVV
ncbi:MAG: DNA-directed RNA polymerase subunit H [Nanoarchaeota archaeon]